MLNTLFIGDIVGETGIKALEKNLAKYKEKYKLDLIVANGENSSDGKGLKYNTLQDLYALGIDIITMGNHTWDKKEILEFIDYEPSLLRPYNLAPNLPGKGYTIYEVKEGVFVGVINLLGAVYLSPSISPFHVVEKIIEEIKEVTPIIFIDFHAEVTSEKMALAWFLDGRVSGVFGTHTHVQTADERILPEGTAYITDLGMTGPKNSILGVKREIIIERFMKQMPVRFEIAKGKGQINALYVQIDEKSGKALNIERIFDFA